MQGLADGYFVFAKYAANYLASQMGKRPSPDAVEFDKQRKIVHARMRNS